MVDGVQIEIGGQKFILPPLGLAGLKKMQAINEKFTGMTDDERMDANIEIVHAALTRNYPDLTLDEVRERIHAYEVTELIDALPTLYARSGVAKRGEQAGGATQNRSNGDGSTQE